MTSLVSFSLKGPSNVASHIAFYVNRKQRDRADDALIKVNINNPQTRKLDGEWDQMTAVYRCGRNTP